jgi:hypothetical protein
LCSFWGGDFGCVRKVEKQKKYVNRTSMPSCRRSRARGSSMAITSLASLIVMSRDAFFLVSVVCFGLDRWHGGLHGLVLVGGVVVCAATSMPHAPDRHAPCKQNAHAARMRNERMLSNAWPVTQAHTP